MTTPTDQFGAITLPVDAPSGNQVVSDPFLYYALAYFQAYVNAKGTDAWHAVQPGQPPIRRTFAHDPEQVVFSQEALPALFMWREESGGGGQFGTVNAAEWIAEDYLVSTDTIRCLWVFPNAVQEIRRIREPIVNGLIKALAVSIDIGRDPSWIVAGDTDPQAATYGSVFVRWAGAMSLSLSRWQRKALVIRPTEGTPMTYESVEARLTLQELMTEDVSRYPAMGAGSLDIKLNDSTDTLLVDERII